MAETSSTEMPEYTIGAAPASSRVRLADWLGYRDLFAFLVWRNIKVLYKETVLGFAWAVLRPVLSMVGIPPEVLRWRLPGR